MLPSGSQSMTAVYQRLEKLTMLTTCFFERRKINTKAYFHAIFVTSVTLSVFDSFFYVASTLPYAGLLLMFIMVTSFIILFRTEVCICCVRLNITTQAWLFSHPISSFSFTKSGVPSPVIASHPAIVKKRYRLLMCRILRSLTFSGVETRRSASGIVPKENVSETCVNGNVNC